MIKIINGPNLNLLGSREPSVYGTQSFSEILGELRTSFKEETLEYFQSNSEGELIDALHQTSQDCKGVVLNAGAYTHTSLALADAIAAIKVPVIEVHLSNVYSREPVRQTSLIAASCKGVITGLGKSSYYLAVKYFTLNLR